jgi:uncharacterized protein YpmB
MTRKRNIVIGIFILATLLFVFNRFYLSVQNKYWNDTTAAVELAYEKSIMTKATKVESFHGDESFHIIFGEDKIGQQLIAWVSEQEEVHTEMVDEAYKEAQLREDMKAKEPDAELLRVLPGKMGDQLVWEVFYKKQEAASGERYYYDYYQFNTGTYIDTWRLSLQ